MASEPPPLDTIPLIRREREGRGVHRNPPSRVMSRCRGRPRLQIRGEPVGRRASHEAARDSPARSRPRADTQAARTRSPADVRIEGGRLR